MSADTHHVLVFHYGEPEVMHAFLSWGDAQSKYQLLDAERRASGASLSTLWYAVRNSDDPKYAHLAPRTYASKQAAAKALANRLNKQTGSYPRAYLNGLLMGDPSSFGRVYSGWATTAQLLSRQGYLVALPDGRAYLTTLADTLKKA